MSSPEIIIKDCETVDEATELVELLTENGVKRDVIRIE